MIDMIELLLPEEKMEHFDFHYPYRALHNLREFITAATVSIDRQDPPNQHFVYVRLPIRSE